MSDKREMARTIRVGAAALRKIATRETDPTSAAELIRVASEMEEHAAELEASALTEQRDPSSGTAA
jgi:hypothetical protein